MAGGTHAGGMTEINWVEKYIERLADDMKEIRGMEGRMNQRIDGLNNRVNQGFDELNNRMNNMRDDFNNRMNSMHSDFSSKIDNNSKHINNLVLAMAVGIGVAVVSAVISITSFAR